MDHAWSVDEETQGRVRSRARQFCFIPTIVALQRATATHRMLCCTRLVRQNCSRVLSTSQFSQHRRIYRAPGSLKFTYLCWPSSFALPTIQCTSVCVFSFYAIALVNIAPRRVTYLLHNLILCACVIYSLFLTHFLKVRIQFVVVLYTISKLIREYFFFT